MRQLKLGDKREIEGIRIGDLVRVIGGKSSYVKAQIYKVVKIYDDGFLGLVNVKVKSSYTFCNREYIEMI